MAKMKNADYMMSESMSEPSNMPRGNKSINYESVDCGGVMASDSVRKSDADSSKMASKLKSQLVAGKF